MEKAIFPIKYMKQTQGVDGEYSHRGTLAIDYGHKFGKTDVYAPFTGIIKRISPASGNAVWLESKNKVRWANGEIDYMTVLTIHDNDVSDLFVGKEIKKGEIYYQMGDAGNATGVHLHLEVGKGKFVGNGWVSNSRGSATINNPVHPADALFVTEDVEIVYDGGYNYRLIVGNPLSKSVNEDQIEVLTYNLRCRKKPMGEIIGYIKEGIYNILEKVDQDGYQWFKVEEDRWIAHSEEWSRLYFKEDMNELLEKYKNENQILKEELEQLKKELIFSYEVPATDKYVIQLNKGEILKLTK